jgi:hypothetical protein
MKFEEQNGDLSQRLVPPVSLKRKISLPDLRRSAIFPGSCLENIIDTKNTAVWTEANNPLISDYKFIKEIRQFRSSFSTARKGDAKLKIEFAQDLKRLSKTEEKATTLTFRNTPRDSIGSTFRQRSPHLSFSEPVKQAAGDTSSVLVTETSFHQITFSEDDLIKSPRKIKSYMNLGEMVIKRNNSNTSLSKLASLAKVPSSKCKPSSDSMIRPGLEKRESSTTNSSLITTTKLQGFESPSKCHSPGIRPASAYIFQGMRRQDFYPHKREEPGRHSMIMPKLQEVVSNMDVLVKHGLQKEQLSIKHPGKKYLLVKREEGPLAERLRIYKENH